MLTISNRLQITIHVIRIKYIEISSVTISPKGLPHSSMYSGPYSAVSRKIGSNLYQLVNDRALAKQTID